MKSGWIYASFFCMGAVFATMLWSATTFKAAEPPSYTLVIDSTGNIRDILADSGVILNFDHIFWDEDMVELIQSTEKVSCLYDY